MSSDNDFFKTAQGSLEKAMAFWPSPHEADQKARDSALLRASQGIEMEPGLAASGAVCVGRVVAVAGSQVVAHLDHPEHGVNEDGRLRKGTLVKIIARDNVTYGLVTALTVPVPGQDNASAEVELAELELVGELAPQKGRDRTFRRGVSNHPVLGNFVFIADAEDLDLVYCARAAGALPIGTLHQDPSRVSYVDADRLLGSHFALLGTTGSGKSCGVTVILQRLLESKTGPRILLIDPHNEYATAFPDSAELIRPTDFELPYWLLNGDEICEVVLGFRRHSETAYDAAMLLCDLVANARRQFAQSHHGDNDGDAIITVDTPLPYNLDDVLAAISTRLAESDRADDSRPLRLLKTRIESLCGDARQSFMFGGGEARDSLVEIMSRLFRIPVDGKPLAILDLSAVQSDVLNVVVSVLARLTFDFGMWTRGSHPLLLVCEEAHRYVPATLENGSEATRQALARIAKEGRKYGVSMCVVSQRPAEIAPAILSQCNTVFAFRMTGSRDQGIVRSITTDAAEGLLDMLPALGNAEAVVIGEGVSMPQRIHFNTLPPELRPLSATAIFSDRRADLADDAEIVSKVVKMWRQQTR